MIFSVKFGLNWPSGSGKHVDENGKSARQQYADDNDRKLRPK